MGIKRTFAGGKPLGLARTVDPFHRQYVHVFASASLALAAQQFAKHLVDERGLKYDTVGGYLLSIASVAIQSAHWALTVGGRRLRRD